VAEYTQAAVAAVAPLAVAEAYRPIPAAEVAPMAAEAEAEEAQRAEPEALQIQA